ncbi:hypothetical protein ElyMa_003978300 [Elysia marginata]|uniref:Uncharacterized protein n=1 Tax=Elysia marginata TaxID=1093978 RepID=A0AAV4FXX6_9GAST|nr:hypothetical protein ElyMa_003978300 [Elysia marginata]
MAQDDVPARLLPSKQTPLHIMMSQDDVPARLPPPKQTPLHIMMAQDDFPAGQCSPKQTPKSYVNRHDLGVCVYVWRGGGCRGSAGGIREVPCLLHTDGPTLGPGQVHTKIP